MFFAFGALHGVVGAGPERMWNGLGGVFMKGLAKEPGTEVAPADPSLLAAALDHRRDAGEQLVVIMGVAERFDVPIVFGDGGNDGAHLGD